MTHETNESLWGSHPLHSPPCLSGVGASHCWVSLMKPSGKAPATCPDIMLGSVPTLSLTLHTTQEDKMVLHPRCSIRSSERLRDLLGIAQAVCSGVGVIQAFGRRQNYVLPQAVSH